MTRPNWEQYFISIAEKVASRATCPRARVGAVIVKDNRILSTGYNGAPSGAAHCDDVGCNMMDNHCIRTIHAETNAIAQAARFGTPLNGATMYLWSDTKIGSCLNCMQVVEAAGIVKVVDNAGRIYESIA